MRLLALLLLVLLLAACAPQPHGKGLLTTDKSNDANATRASMDNVFDSNICVGDGDCGPGRACVNRSCVSAR